MKETHAICRSCARQGLRIFLDLGETPLADRLLTCDQLRDPEPCYPLEVAFCPDCKLVQILETVPPEILFCESYPYYSSFSRTVINSARENVLDLIGTRGLDSGSFIVELASNDGYLLKNYVEMGIPCQGIDPAQGPAKAAEKDGVPTLNAFFSAALSKQLRKDMGQADVIHANNILAHVPDLNGFVEGIRILLKDTGVAVIEVPYVKDLIDKCEFDTIYHEHLCYFSVTALDNLFRRHSLNINDIQKIPMHGGSLRLYVSLKQRPAEAVNVFLYQEMTQKVISADYFRDFTKRVESVKADLLELLHSKKSAGKRIAAYGAAAKGSTLINTVGIGKEIVEFVVDRNIYKQGLFMPGKHLPIFDTIAISEKSPDFLLLLAWNFSDEIMQQLKEYPRKGGKFILPIPEPEVVYNLSRQI